MDKTTYLSELEKELKNLSETDRENALAYYGEYLDDAESAGQNDASSVLGSPHTLAAQVKADIAMSPLIGELIPTTPTLASVTTTAAPMEGASEEIAASSGQDLQSVSLQTAQPSNFPQPQPINQQMPDYQQPPSYQQPSGYQQAPSNQQTTWPQQPQALPQTKKSGMGVIWTVILGILAIPVGLPLAIALVAVIISVLAVLFSLLVSLAAIVLSFFVTGIVSGISGFIFLFSSTPVGLFYLGSGFALIGLSFLFAIAFWQLGMLSIKGVARLFNAIRKKLTRKEMVAK